MESKAFELSELKGKTIVSVEGNVGDLVLTLTDSDGVRYEFYHDQDCCETVEIEDISGDISDIIGSPILVAEETISNENPAGWMPKSAWGQDDSFTWTFYRFATAKGWVVIRWYGASNGYYSESVDFRKIEPKK